jgi:hypothetical protein
MGGYGSGERFFSKATTDHALRLDVRWLAREGIIRPGVLVSTSLHWTRNGKPDGDIRVRYDADRPHELILDYRTRGPLDAEWTDVRERIRLERTPCHYGGERVWCRCPGCWPTPSREMIGSPSSTAAAKRSPTGSVPSGNGC